MQEFEKVGVFYIGREYDAKEKVLKDNIILYDSKDLCTHAVCIGMTGSGKTGLCITLLEEAAIDGIPAIVVDPKGDLPNLLLTFPELNGKNFLPWVNPEEARMRNISLEEYAEEQAALWKKGLAEWQQDEERIKRLKEAAEYVVYTPGSTAGLPVSILSSFKVPQKEILEDNDILRERINTIVTSLLNLMNIEADPLQSREHILISCILDYIWKQNKSVDLSSLIEYIQNPPFEKIGVLNVDVYFPPKDRFSLAMKLNNLLASPGFSVWLEGEPLDIDNILYSDTGKPRMAIFSIAHLNDSERMFFVTLLLSQLIGWMRTQPGTTSLRSIFYMDEIFGYFPPVSNPPSKQLLLTLLKQARAFGLGIVLSTQNPVDLDYKGLSNAGTWFIGRLQTEQDKARILDGLQGGIVSAGKPFDRQKIDSLLSSLGKRVFLMNNVHEDEPILFQSRWALSYLPGPLTRNQIKLLMDAYKNKFAETKQFTLQQQPTGIEAVSRTKFALSDTKATKTPNLPPEIIQYFIPPKLTQPQNAQLFYQPAIIGCASIYYNDTAASIQIEKKVSYLAEFENAFPFINWQNAREININPDDLQKAPCENCIFADITNEIAKPLNYNKWNKEFREWLFRNQAINLFSSPLLKLVSGYGESERDFKLRLQLAAREKRDDILEKIRQKYALRINQIEAKMRKAQEIIDRETKQVSQQALQTAISIGSTILGAILGRKRMTTSTLGRATTSARGASKILKEKQDVSRAKENLVLLQNQLDEVQKELAQEISNISNEFDRSIEVIEPYIIKPKKTDIVISLFGLAWVPYWMDEMGNFTLAFN